jgi:hydroxymethylpyrimidine pyrophosphatase-like HAD family hydrolase
MRIKAILSDYDGTLCPTGSLRGKYNTIPKELDDILWSLSENLPVCIISSKDFNFLHRRTRFAKIVSCILGIETLLLRSHKMQKAAAIDANCTFTDLGTNNLDCCITSRHLSTEVGELQGSSHVLENLANDVESNFKEVIIERKCLTTDNNNNGTLAGITIDWRHLEDWKEYKKKSEPLLKEIIKKHMQQQLLQQQQSAYSHFPSSGLYLQTYSSHPFIDIYSTNCDKGLAFDCIDSEFSNSVDNSKRNKILYLGDSENDNPAFRKADVSIGVRSDERLNPRLDCKYIINFNELPAFLKQLYDNNFIFSATFLEKIRRD